MNALKDSRMSCALQAKSFSKLLQHGVEQRSGILEAYSCCLLSREPGFLNHKIISAQVWPCFLS